MQEKATGQSGLICIDKPAGPTSHDVVAHVRRRTGIKQTGHSGTLDPFATGLLIVAIGPATRLLEYTHDLPKTYVTTITLGATSDTDDRTGHITPTLGKIIPTSNQILHTLTNFTGSIQQIPPQYSAVKVAGQRAYHQARIGKRVDLKPRPVTVYSISLRAYHYPTLELEIICGGGTYIRSLARDIGKSLGTEAYAQELRRTSIGGFDVTNAVALDMLSTASLSSHLLPPQKLVEHLPHITLTPSNVAKFKMGQAIEAKKKIMDKNPVVVFDEEKSLIGIGHLDPNTSLLHPTKVLS